MRRTLAALGLAVALAGVPGRGEAQESPFVYHRLPGATPLRLELEAGVGTRDARPFGDAGVEQALTIEVAPLPWLALVVRGALLYAGAEVRTSAGAEAVLRLRVGEGLELRAAGGVGRDPREDIVLRAWTSGRLTRGLLDVVLSGLVEVPLAEDRDTADLVLGLAAMARAHERLRAGGEVLIEDLEGLWEPDEAEGGVRLLLGPALWVRLSARLDLKLHAGVTVAQGQAGFLGRLALGLAL
jgi:hypothetical protein